MNNVNILEVQPLGFPWKTYDPFLFCAYHKDNYPAGNNKLGVGSNYLHGRNVGSDFNIKDGFRMYHGNEIPGFPKHPHRGFETITINKAGYVDHSDSLGSKGRFGKGDVQWMTAGRGIQHSEMFPLLDNKNPNPLEILQIWLNLPQRNKFVKPHFKMLWDDMVPSIVELDENGKSINIDVISGKLNDISAPSPNPESWANHANNNILILTMRMDSNASWVLNRTTDSINRTIYFYKGETLNINSKTIMDNHLVKVKSEESTILLNGNKESFILLLQGRPINEPIAQYGPFVMNTKQEIREAFDDYHKTQFGAWPWQELGPIHDRAIGRFTMDTKGVYKYK